MRFVGTVAVGLVHEAPASVQATPALQTYVAKAAAQPAPAPGAPPKAADIKTTMLDLSPEPHRFISEDDVLSAARDGHKLIRHSKDAIITPLARDAAAAKGIELIELA